MIITLVKYEPNAKNGRERTNSLGGCQGNNKGGEIWVRLWKMTNSPQNTGHEKQNMVNSQIIITSSTDIHKAKIYYLFSLPT